MPSKRAGVGQRSLDIVFAIDVKPNKRRPASARKIANVESLPGVGTIAHRGVELKGAQVRFAVHFGAFIAGTVAQERGAGIHQTPRPLATPYDSETVGCH